MWFGTLKAGITVHRDYPARQHRMPIQSPIGPHVLVSAISNRCPEDPLEWPRGSVSGRGGTQGATTGKAYQGPIVEVSWDRRTFGVIFAVLWPHVDDNGRPTYFRRAFLGAARPFFRGAVMLNSSSFFPDFSAAASHRGLSPRPAHVSAGLSGLRYFGATAPRRPPRTPLPRDPPAARRSNLLSWSRTARRSSITLALTAASTCSLSFDNLSIDIDLRFMMIHFWFVSVPLTLRQFHLQRE